MIISHQDHRIELLSERAIFLPDHSALVLSDVHLGKAASFQAHGLPVPEGDDLVDLTRISHLLEITQARELVIVGDLLHSPRGISPQLISQLEQWMSQCPAKITLVLGNHDRRAIKAYHIESAPMLKLGAIHLIHDPADTSDHFSICGHLHPVSEIKDRLRGYHRTPCFWLTDQMLVLPSFGTFTGGHPIKPAPENRVFSPLKGRVIELPAHCWK